MKGSIKLKITLWYTCIFSLVLLVILASVYWVSRSYSTHDIKEELRDETADMVEQLSEFAENAPSEDAAAAFANEDWPVFYDDNVMVSLYTVNGEWIGGLTPDKFPEDYPFEQEVLRKWNGAEGSWLVFDYLYDYSDGKSLWIRSIASYSSWSRILHRMMQMFTILFPLFVIFTAWIGYRMLSKALRPIYTISDTASEIALSVDLSKRIPEGGTKDEFSYLIETFNMMLEELEQSFQQEKQFTSDAAHELRTPVAVVLAHCEYCLDELKMDAELEKEVRIIYDKTQRMRRLIGQLLSLTRAEKRSIRLEKEEIQLAFLAESVIEELEEKAAKKHITLKLEDYTDNAVIQGDMTLLLRMLLNLVDNAISYGKENGYAKISIDPEGGRTRIRVEDDGIGIAGDDLDKIWNRFYRADKSRSGDEGFGLGLYMVKWIVQMHGGTITVESEYGKGTAFEVLL